MLRITPVILSAAMVAGLVCVAAPAQADVAVVSNIKVVSDKVPDVSSLEVWKENTIKPGMTDQEKAVAVWKTVVQHQHQSTPPNEFLHHEGAVTDFIKMANVYGYSLCSVAAAHVMELSRYAGMPARGETISGHCLSEIQYGGAWHLYDASLINYFPKPDGQVASMAEIQAAVKDWYEANPDFKAKDRTPAALKERNDKLFKFGREDNGWGFKKGPALLAACPFYSVRGWWPAKTHGWYSTMQEYDGSVLFAYESGYSQGYRVNIQLRPGEKLTRNWSNKGLYGNMDGTAGKAPVDSKIGEGDMVHLPGFGDMAPGRIGNGTTEYNVPVAGIGAGPLVVRMPCSYMYLTGKVDVDAVVPAGGSIGVQLSDNNGLDWKDVTKIEKTGKETYDISKLVLRRYDYRLKLTLAGPGTAITALRITHDIQHSQRPLPALGEGANAVTFSAGPQEGTVTIEGSTAAASKGKALVVADFHPTIDGFNDGNLVVNKNEGVITFPVETPGDMARLRFGCFAQMTNPNASLDLDVSFDGGKTWKSVAQQKYEGRFVSLWPTFSEIPAGTRKALVRYTARGNGNTSIANLRIDADYQEPAGGFRPVKVTYVWSEDGADKTDVHVAQTPNEKWTIPCAKKPLMKSITLELAQ